MDEKKSSSPLNEELLDKVAGGGASVGHLAAWTCTNCGQTDNTGEHCGNCGQSAAINGLKRINARR